MKDWLKPKGDTVTMRMPTSNPGGARFRGPTSSQEYNQNEYDKYTDLVELYKQSNDNEIALEQANKVLLAENIALNNYINMLENRMLTLEQRLESLGGSNWYNGSFHKTSFVDDMTSKYPSLSQDNGTNIPRCSIDLQYRYATIPIIHQIPKTHMVGKDGERVIPQDLKVTVGRTNTSGEVKENDVLNAFNGDDESFWVREVSYPVSDTTTVEDAIIEIELPLKMINDLNVNTIQVHPHPERGIAITNIEIQHQNGWQQIEGFAQDDISSAHGDSFSPRKKWYFPNIPVQKIRVTLEQHNPIERDGNKVFVLGAQEIGIYLTTFEPSGGMVLIPFDMSNVGLYNIESVEHIFLNRGAFSYPRNMDNLLENNIFNYEILKETINGDLIPISNSEWINQTATRIWIKTQLKPDPDPSNGVNPCLHAVRLHYTKG